MFVYKPGKDDGFEKVKLMNASVSHSDIAIAQGAVKVGTELKLKVRNGLKVTYRLKNIEANTEISDSVFEGSESSGA